MALSSSLIIGFRSGATRFAAQKSVTSHVSSGSTRLYSSLLQRSRTSPRIVLSPLQSRQSARSVWGTGGGSQAPVPPVAEIAATTPVIEEATSAAAVAASSIPTSEPASVVEVIKSVDPSALESVTQAATNAVATHGSAVLQWGEMASLGLTGWTPAGFVRWSMELIHLGLNIPWFWTIVGGTAAWRFFCLPFILKGLRTSAALVPIQAQLTALQERVTAASATKNPVEMQKAATAMRKLYADNGISPLGGLVALVQVPVTLGLFFGIKTMTSLPLESLKYSGFSLIPDLTAVDPTYILPALLIAAINVQITAGAREINIAERPDMGHVMNAMRILTIPGAALMAYFPAGLIVSMLTTATLTITQSYVLRIPAVRRALKIPVIPREQQGKLPSFRQTFQRAKDFLGDDLSAKVAEAKRLSKEQQRMDQLRRH